MPLKDADILLVGVSRSKTPTSMYLAHRGCCCWYSCAGAPEFRSHSLILMDDHSVVGRTVDPKAVDRRTRQIATFDDANEGGADLEAITEEVRQARRLFTQNQCR